MTERAADDEAKLPEGDDGRRSTTDAEGLPELEDLEGACAKLPALLTEVEDEKSHEIYDEKDEVPTEGHVLQPGSNPGPRKAAEVRQSPSELKEAEEPEVALPTTQEIAESPSTGVAMRVEEDPTTPPEVQCQEEDDVIALESQAMLVRVAPSSQVSQNADTSVCSSRAQIQVQEVEGHAVQVYERPLLAKTHVVLLGDSTLDNERYLDVNAGGEPVALQLSRRCSELDWELTMLATDGSTLEDVAIRQVPVIPDDATHLVLSASGNDLLRLLNEVASAEFSMSSLYSAMTQGLQEVARKYRRILESMASTGCHIACCTVYRPNFKNTFLTGLSLCSLGLHNSRIRRIAEDLDMPVLDLANLCQDATDFANPLELSTSGGRKVVFNVVQFVKDNPHISRSRHQQRESQYSWLPDVLGISTECCHNCAPRRNYAVHTHEDMVQEIPVAHPTEFSQAQEQWRKS